MSERHKFTEASFWGMVQISRKEKNLRVRDRKSRIRRLKIPKETQTTSINFVPSTPSCTLSPWKLGQKRENIHAGREDAPRLIGELTSPEQRKTRYIRGRTNRRMANAAVRHFGFREVIPPSGPRHDNVEVIASRRTFLTKLRKKIRI